MDSEMCRFLAQIIKGKDLRHYKVIGELSYYHYASEDKSILSIQFNLVSVVGR